MTDARCELPPPRHLSRWAAVSAAAAVLALVDYVILATAYFQPARALAPLEQVAGHAGWNVTPAQWELIALIEFWLLFAAGLVGGPICLFVAKIAELDLDRQPTVQGESLASFAVAVGWGGSVASMLFIASAALLHIFG